MKISARVDNSFNSHAVTLTTNDQPHVLTVGPKPDGFGSRANGGELLCLALATCYCNDLYREARKRSIDVERVQVEVDGAFGGEGEPAQGFVYRAEVAARTSREQLLDLMRHTDAVAEVQNTLRRSCPVSLENVIAHAVPGPTA